MVVVRQKDKAKKNGDTLRRQEYFCVTHLEKEKRLERRLDKLSVTVWVDLFSSSLITPDWTKLIRIRVMPFGCIDNKSDKVIKTWQVLRSGVVVCVVCVPVRACARARAWDLTNTTGRRLQLAQQAPAAATALGEKHAHLVQKLTVNCTGGVGVVCRGVGGVSK